MEVAGARTEPYPDVVLPVVSLLELLCRVGKSLQSKQERISEPGEGETSRAFPTSTWDHGCHPIPLGHPPRPCHPSAMQAGGQKEGWWAAMPREGYSRAWGASVSLLAPAFPRASWCPQRNSCYLNSTRAEPPHLGGCWHYCWSQAGSHLQHRARAEPMSLCPRTPSSLQGRADPSKMLQTPHSRSWRAGEEPAMRHRSSACPCCLQREAPGLSCLARSHPRLGQVQPSPAKAHKTSKERKASPS